MTTAPGPRTSSSPRAGDRAAQLPRRCRHRRGGAPLGGWQKATWLWSPSWPWSSASSSAPSSSSSLRRPRCTPGATCSPRPGHAFGVTFSTLGNAYGALFTGSIFSPSAVGHAISTGSGWTSGVHPDLGNPGVGDPAHPGRDRGRARLFDRRVQHRRPGPAHLRGHGGYLRRFRRAPTSSCSTCRWWCSPAPPAGLSPGSSPAS